MRRLLLAAACAVGLWVGAQTAGAAPAPSAQESSDDIAAWVSTTLQVPVEARPVVVRQLEHGHDGEYDPVSDVVTLAPWTAAPTSLGLYVQLHELLHKPDTAAGCYREEEAIVDALTRDLAPALVWRTLGVPLSQPVQTVYDARGPAGEPSVGDVRAASAAAVGQSWRSRDARLWRRALWAQGCDGRQAMLEQANAIAGVR